MHSLQAQCRVCGYAKSWHKTDEAGNEVLKASVRAWVGNTKPPVCWYKENKRGDTNLNIRGGYLARRVA